MELYSNKKVFSGLDAFLQEKGAGELMNALERIKTVGKVQIRGCIIRNGLFAMPFPFLSIKYVLKVFDISNIIRRCYWRNHRLLFDDKNGSGICNVPVHNYTG